MNWRFSNPWGVSSMYSVTDTSAVFVFSRASSTT